MSSVDDLDFPFQDYVMLGGKRSPGLAVVRGAGSPRSWDIRKGYAFSGATVVYTGADLSKPEVDIIVWKAEHFAAFDVFARAVLAAPVGEAAARANAGLGSLSLSIDHPLLSAPPISISQVVVVDVSQWEQDPDGGMWMRTIKLLAYRAPIPVLVRPMKGPPPSPVVVKPPVDPREQQIAANAVEIARLGQ